MAKGRTWRTRLLLLLGIIGYASLVATEVAPNPFPAIWEWVDKERPLAADLAWQERLGAKPSTVVAADGLLAVDAGRGAQVRSQTDGALVYPLGSEDRVADWVAVAGTGEAAVVVTGERLTSGYEVRHLASGVVLRVAEETDAVWTFQDALLDLRCPSLSPCELRRFPPDGLEPLWSVDIADDGAVIAGLNPDLAAARLDLPDGIDDAVSGRPRLPRLLGLPVGRHEVVVVNTATGRVARVMELDRDEKVMVIGDRVIRSVAVNRAGVCVVTVSGLDAVTGVMVWGPAPLHLQTVSGAGCGQDDAPVAAGAAVVAIAPDGHELVLDAYDGRVLWRGEAGERVAALSPELAVIRTVGEEEAGVYAVALGGDGEPIWERAVSEDAGLALVPCGLVVADEHADRVRVWTPTTGDERLSVRTGAWVAACTPEGVVLADGRSIALARWAGSSDSGGAEGGAGERGNGEGEGVDAPYYQK